MSTLACVYIHALSTLICVVDLIAVKSALAVQLCFHWTHFTLPVLPSRVGSLLVYMSAVEVISAQPGTSALLLPLP